MIKSYLKTAWRSLVRNRVNSIINISGLSIGLASVIFIVMYVKNELSYDRFLKNIGQVFQVNMTFTDKGVVNTTGGNTAPAVTPTMAELYPEIEGYARLYRPGDITVRYQGANNELNFFTERALIAVDSNFLDLFRFPLTEGDPSTCLQKPDAIVLTESTAKKYFGSEKAVGKLLLLENARKPFIVTAVLKDIPENSTFRFDMLAPIRAYPEVKKRSWNWFWLQVNSYVKLRPDVAADRAAIAQLEAKFAPMVKEHAFNKNYGQDYDEFVKKGNKLEYSLMKFTDLHLKAIPRQVPARLTTLSDIKYVYIFSAIAFFIIVLACVNFMNLSTAQAGTRSREVAVRKVLGSERKQLIRQFLSEAFLYSFISTVLALVLVALTIAAFNNVSGKLLEFASIFKSGTGLLLLILFVFTGLLSGIYPAFYLTSFNPVSIFKGINISRANAGNIFMRNGLVIFQFTVSIGLIICTIIVFQQLKYTQSKDLGLNKESVLLIANTRQLGKNEEVFRQELINLPEVKDASVYGSIPTKGNFGDGYVPEETETDKPLLSEIGLSSFMTDEHFVPVFNMQMITGRNFSKEMNDSASVILNETAAKQIGWKDPVGKYLAYPGNDQRFKVIGVVKDFNISSLREVIEPFALFHNSSKTYYINSSFISLRLGPGNMMNQVERIKSSWKSFAPDAPFDYSFMDEEFDALYRSEQRMGKVFSIFTVLSIFVACLGLFGLSVFTAERRKKEMGVRKVLGASATQIVTLLSGNFLRLVLIAALIAFPISWMAMNSWLQDFAYRINISGWIFIVAGISALLIALATVCVQGIKAAMTNPVEALREV